MISSGDDKKEKSNTKNNYADKKTMDMVQRNSRKAANREFGETLNSIVHSKAFKVGVAVAASIAISYGAYRLSEIYKSNTTLEKAFDNIKSINELENNNLSDVISNVDFSDQFKPFEIPGIIKEYYGNLVEQSEAAFEKLPIKYSSLDSIPKVTNNALKQFFDSTGDSAEKALLSGINHGADILTNNKRNMNCGLCSMSIIARLKGLDVTAAELSDLPGLPREIIEECFNGGKFLKSTSRNMGDIINGLVSKGDGSYGIMFVPWKTGGAHFVSYAVKNGNVEFLDGQIENLWDAKEVLGRATLDNVMVMDCTNLDLTKKALHCFL